MQADVGLAADDPVLPLDDHHRLARQLEGDVIAGIDQGGGAADAVPFPGEYVLQLGGEELFRGIDAFGHGARLLEGLGDVCGQFGNGVDRGVKVHGQQLRA